MTKGEEWRRKVAGNARESANIAASMGFDARAMAEKAGMSLALELMERMQDPSAHRYPGPEKDCRTCAAVYQFFEGGSVKCRIYGETVPQPVRGQCAWKVEGVRYDKSIRDEVDRVREYFDSTRNLVGA